MAYLAELGPGQQVYVDNPGGQTVITVVSASAGQQQQSSQSFTTGVWTAPPRLVRLNKGLAIQLFTPQGERTIQIQSGQISAVSQSASQAQSQPMTETALLSAPLPPMAPLPPLQMGNMQMSLDPMEMRMGDMSLQMKGAERVNNSEARSAEQSPKFCSQCGYGVKSGDRFCSQCGHQL